MTVFILGIRHHGPGSARAVRDALDEVRPDVVLIEGAPELDAVLGLIADPEMRPPVAGLVYAPEETRRAAFYPLAVFSPEWVAARWALAHGVEVHFADLPAAHQLALRSEDHDDDGDDEPGDDPITTLAATAGFDDPERWWEDAVEHRYGGLDRFAAVTEVMAELREDGPLAGRRRPAGPEAPARRRPANLQAPARRRPANDRREAAMRRTLRATMKRAGPGATIVFVCGAWHAPALQPGAFPSVKHDTDLLKGLPKVKVAATWVPWTNGRLSYRSGYGAGVASPGWYEHLFTAVEAAGPPGAADDVAARWLTRTARLLRDEELPTSSASVIEAVRLADALATLRGRPLAGVSELTDATESVLCAGSPVPLAVVGEKLFVGEGMGAVPDATPMVPLARDLERQQKRLRLRVSEAEQVVTLDLRTDNHRARSHLLHRLGLLGVPWGESIDSGRTRGTFKETWRLQWHPELALRLIDASGRGTTIAEAAAATVSGQVADADIATLTGLIETALLADLPAALTTAMAALAARAARQHDTQRLMAAVEPLARITRYGNVRQVDTELVASVLDGIATRVAIGLGPACHGLDDDAAQAMGRLVDGVHRGLALVDNQGQRERWYGALAGVADQGGVHGTVGGRATRLLLDGGRITPADANRRLSLHLSTGADALDSASWLDSFLAGDASLLLHDDELLAVVDDWLSEVPGPLFDALLPLVRRTFSAFSAPERRLIGGKVSRLDGTAPRGVVTREDDPGVDDARACRALPVLRLILGTSP